MIGYVRPKYTYVAKGGWDGIKLKERNIPLRYIDPETEEISFHDTIFNSIAWMPTVDQCHIITKYPNQSISDSTLDLIC